jgi:hypothetical protein
MGPEGLLLVWALTISALVAVLAWRRVGLAAGFSATLALAIAFAIWQAMMPETNPAINVRIVATSFIIVPSLLLLGASRQRWIARHAWVLVLLGPIVFAGCYVGICELCVKTGVI